MSLERLIENWLFTPDPFDCWRPDPRTQPHQPQRPGHPRPKRPRASPAPFRLNLEDAALEIIGAAKDDDNRDEAMIWEAGRIHGPEGDRATELAIECALAALEDGEPLSWWDAEWTADDGLAAMSAVFARDDFRDADRRRMWAEDAATDAASETDPEWLAYDEAVASFKAAEQEWYAAAIRRGREVSGYASEAEHRAAVTSPADRLFKKLESRVAEAYAVERFQYMLMQNNRR